MPLLHLIQDLQGKVWIVGGKAQREPLGGGRGPACEPPPSTTPPIPSLPCSTTPPTPPLLWSSQSLRTFQAPPPTASLSSLAEPSLLFISCARGDLLPSSSYLLYQAPFLLAAFPPGVLPE